MVEVAMQEAAYATLTSQLEAYWQTGERAAAHRQCQPRPRADQRLSDQ